MKLVSMLKETALQKLEETIALFDSRDWSDDIGMGLTMDDMLECRDSMTYTHRALTDAIEANHSMKIIMLSMAVAGYAETVKQGCKSQDKRLGTHLKEVNYYKYTDELENVAKTMKINIDILSSDEFRNSDGRAWLIKKHENFIEKISRTELTGLTDDECSSTIFDIQSEGYELNIQLFEFQEKHFQDNIQECNETLDKFKKDELQGKALQLQCEVAMSRTELKYDFGITKNIEALEALVQEHEETEIKIRDFIKLTNKDTTDFNKLANELEQIKTEINDVLKKSKEFLVTDCIMVDIDTIDEMEARTSIVL